MMSMASSDRQYPWRPDSETYSQAQAVASASGQSLNSLLSNAVVAYVQTEDFKKRRDAQLEVIRKLSGED